MSGLGGGGDITNTEARLGSFRVQQSSQGVPIALLWGRNRVSPNLLWFDDFEAIEQRSSQEAGKGGGTTVTNVSYTYRASLLVSLCAGVRNGGATGVTTVWRNKEKLTGTTRSLPSEQLTHVEILPVGKVVTVPDAARWASTVAVYTRVPGDYAGSFANVPTSDYTVSAGVYTFGATLTAGETVGIDYILAGVTETLTALQQAEFSVFASGAVGQTAWGYLTTAHPDKALGYSGITYVAAYKLLLGGAAGLPQMGFEVDGPAQVGGGNFDANPADILSDLLTDPIYGAGFPSGQLASLSIYRAWCNAAGLWLSPVWAERKGVFEYVSQLAKITHSKPLWSVNTLKLVPMATAALGGYTPAAEHSAPVYAFNDDDFSGPIEELRSGPADRYNRVSVSYRSRALEYADAIESAEDRASIDAFGLIELPEVVQVHEAATLNVAAVISELLLREYMVQGNQYRFIVPISYDLLEPLDLVQIEDVRIDLAPTVVRVTEITETGDDGALQVVAEEVSVTGSVTQSRQASGGYVYASGPPDAVTVRAVMMPTAATGNAQQLWVGVTAGANWGGAILWASSTGNDYRRIADINVRARMGTLASGIASASVELNPTQTLSVDVVGSTTIASATQVDADAYRSLVWVNGELLSFRDATLVAAARYDLTYLRRALYGTTSPAHSTGDAWMRLDDALAKIDISNADLGSTLYLKVTSRNALGTYLQGLEEVAALPVLLTAQPSTPDAVQGMALTAPFISNYFEVNWQATPRASDYQIELRDAASNLLRTVYTSALVWRYVYADAIDDGDAKRTYSVKVRARNIGGNGPFTTLAVANPAPAAVTGVAATGSGTSRTITWTASTASDRAGYLARYSTTAGFNPNAGQGTAFYDGTAATASLTGLTVGTVYKVRVAAYDIWDKDIADLIWSTEYSFTA